MFPVTHDDREWFRDAYKSLTKSPPLIWRLLNKCLINWDISSNSVAFLKNMNLTYIIIKYISFFQLKMFGQETATPDDRERFDHDYGTRRCLFSLLFLDSYWYRWGI